MALIIYFDKASGKSKLAKKMIEEKFVKYLYKLDTLGSAKIDSMTHKLRGWEANTSKLYFRWISQQLPKDMQFEKRSKRPALDPFNASLNYCYGILYNKIEGMIIKAGLDPHIGIFHVDQHNTAVLVFDIIEIFRNWAEFSVIQAFQNKVLQKHDFSIEEERVSITSEGKKILIELFFSYMNEKVKWRDERAKRIVHMNRYIVNIATMMRNYKSNESKTSGI